MFSFVKSWFKVSSNNSTSTKQELQKDLEKAVLEKRFEDAATIQDKINNLETVEKLQIDLKMR